MAAADSKARRPGAAPLPRGDDSAAGCFPALVSLSPPRDKHITTQADGRS